MHKSSLTRMSESFANRLASLSCCFNIILRSCEQVMNRLAAMERNIPLIHILPCTYVCSINHVTSTLVLNDPHQLSQHYDTVAELCTVAQIVEPALDSIFSWMTSC